MPRRNALTVVREYDPDLAYQTRALLVIWEARQARLRAEAETSAPAQTPATPAAVPQEGQTDTQKRSP